MTLALRSSDPDLRDLAQDRPALIDAPTGAPSGLRLVRGIGSPGLVAVGGHPAGVRVVDELGGWVVLRPADFAAMRPIEG
ncbi:hypothetical protein [Sorangium sp. So ce542]|uniref:hypothetical protein n=1 Tax=Sorangium sp. So ce542 TaxID=3133316 RepID=UPI003F62DC68